MQSTLSRSGFQLKQLTPKELTLYRAGKLVRCIDGLGGLTLEQLAEPLCQALGEQFVISEIYRIGFNWDETHYGGLVILIPVGSRIVHNEIVETCIHIGSSAIQRIKDISERKLIEAKLAASRDQLEKIINSIADPIFVKDREHRWILVNEAFCDHIGQPRNVLLGNSDNDFSPQDEADEFWSKDELVFNSGKENINEEKFTDIQGKVHTIATKKTLYTDENGAKYIVGIIRNLTERKKIEEALEKRLIALTSPLEGLEDIKFEDLFNLDEIQKIQDAFAAATGVASCITDTEGRPLTKPSNSSDLCQKIIRQTKKGLKNCYHSDAVLGQMNPSGPSMQPCLSGGLWDGGAGIRAGEHHIANWLIGQVLDDSTDQAAILAYAKKIGADEVEFKKALAKVTRMPKEQFAKVCQALFLIAEQLSRLAIQNVQQARYITERKQAVMKMEILNSELEERVTARTAQLTAANKELESFSYSVSHDLRAPLRGINGFSQILLEDYSDKLDDQGRDYLRRVRAASRRMEELIDDMLILARVTRTEIHRAKVDLSALTQQILAEFVTEHPERQVEQVITPTLTAYGDRNLLRIMLENLLGNAWKFTSKKPKARIEFGVLTNKTYLNQLLGEEWLERQVYFIRDDGVGFAMEFAPKLFGAFQRLHSTDEFEGTGIGLAIVQRIINQHGGRIWAEAEVEKGATFYFTIPSEKSGVRKLQPDF